MSLTVLFNCPRKIFSTRLTSVVHVQTCGLLGLFETIMITNSIQSCVLSKCIGSFQSPATICDEKPLTIRLLSGLFTLSWLYQSFLLVQEATLSFTVYWCISYGSSWYGQKWLECLWICSVILAFLEEPTAPANQRWFFWSYDTFVSGKESCWDSNYKSRPSQAKEEERSLYMRRLPLFSI